MGLTTLSRSTRVPPPLLPSFCRSHSQHRRPEAGTSQDQPRPSPTDHEQMLLEGIHFTFPLSTFHWIICHFLAPCTAEVKSVGAEPTTLPLHPSDVITTMTRAPQRPTEPPKKAARVQNARWVKKQEWRTRPTRKSLSPKPGQMHKWKTIRWCIGVLHDYL